jgi:hypothetical protein
MRVLLKSKQTGLYYRDGDRPAAESDAGRDFATVRAATEFAVAQRLRAMEIALRYDYLNCEIPLPVLQEWCELDDSQRLSV